MPSVDTPLVLRDLQTFLSRSGDPSSTLLDKSATAVPVAAIKALVGVVQRSKAETMMGLQDELQEAAAMMIQHYDKRSNIALQSGCHLFLKYITRQFLELPNFEECRQAILERGERFQLMSLAARDRVAQAAVDFIPPNATVLTHGYSRVVASILEQKSKHQNFDLIILEGRPDGGGVKAAQAYAREANIKTTVVLDLSMAFVMEKVDLVLVGAEGVVENGGVVNKVGTCALAACAYQFGKPFYVAAESYKFARLYPLKQSDLPNVNQAVQFFDEKGQELQLQDSIKVESPSVDYTPAMFITLLFTDLGVLTPAAVSDELIRLYQ